MRIGIIGGGIAGLSAAYELTKKGHFAEVFEQSNFLGGQASTFNVSGGRLERGYHHLFTSDTAITDLIKELGLEARLAWLESSVGFYLDQGDGGKLWNFTTPRDLLMFEPLSLLSRVKVGFWTLILKNIKNYRKFENITAKDWLLKHMGKSAYEIIWEPLLRGKFGEFYDRISMTWIWSKMRLRVGSRKKGSTGELLGYPMGSFGEIIDCLALNITQRGGVIHTSATVGRIVESGGLATTLDVTLHDSAEQHRHYDAIVATTPSYVFTRLAPRMPKTYQSKLDDIDYLSAVLIILVMDRPFTDKYWLNIADPAMPFVALIEHTNLIDPSLYGGNHILYISNYPRRHSELYMKSPEDLLNLFIPHLKRINPEFERSNILEYHYHRVDGAQPIIGLNYGLNLPEHRTPYKGLYLANTTQIYPEDRGTNYSVRMGREVANMVMQDEACDKGKYAKE